MVAFIDFSCLHVLVVTSEAHMNSPCENRHLSLFLDLNFHIRNVVSFGYSIQACFAADWGSF